MLGFVLSTEWSGFGVPWKVLQALGSLKHLFSRPSGSDQIAPFTQALHMSPVYSVCFFQQAVSPSSPTSSRGSLLQALMLGVR